MAIERVAGFLTVNFNIGRINQISKLWKRELAMKKIEESAWKLTYYGTVTIWALFSFIHEPYIWHPFEEWELMAQGNFHSYTL